MMVSRRDPERAASLLAVAEIAESRPCGGCLSDIEPRAGWLIVASDPQEGITTVELALCDECADRMIATMMR